MARRFGIEIEFVWGNSAGRYENAEGLCTLIASKGVQVQNAIRQHFGFSQTHWQLKYDSSVTYGAEIVSPPLNFDDAEQRAQVTKVMESLQEFGCNSDKNAGVHVHVECHDFTPKQLAAVLRFTYKFEDAIYRIASSGWQTMRGTSWCRPIPDQIAKDAMEIREASDVTRLWAQRLPQGRYYMVNVQKWTQTGTLEFRVFNSTLNADRAQAYIALSVAIVNDARNGYSRSTAKHFPAGYMASQSDPAKAEKSMMLKLQQILRYQSGMSEADWKLIRFAWKDSQSQRANIVLREHVPARRTSRRTPSYR